MNKSIMPFVTLLFCIYHEFPKYVFDFILSFLIDWRYAKFIFNGVKNAFQWYVRRVLINFTWQGVMIRSKTQSFFFGIGQFLLIGFSTILG